MSIAREALIREVVKSLRHNANVLQIISRDSTFRVKDYSDSRRGTQVTPISGIVGQLEQYANDLEGRLLP